MSQNNEAERTGEVRVTEYASRVVRRWYIVLVAVVAAVLLVLLNTVGTGKQFQAQATVFLGQPLTPTGGAVFSASLFTNTTSAQAWVRSTEVMAKAAQDADIKSGSVLRSHTSVTVLANSGARTTPTGANVNITVRGPWDRETVATAARSLADSLIEFANKYQQAKIDLLDTQIATDEQTITTLTSVVDQAQKQLDAVSKSSAPSIDQATISATLLSTIATAGSRIDEISSTLTTNKIFKAAAENVESAGYVQEPVGQKVTATKRRSTLIVAAFTGLIVGVILALLWDSVRNGRPRRVEA
ncbi:MAG: hypothetical protein QOF68_1656 [Gaiellales bacterium]|nr:hypothetical protein [Gaiellales bacterium]